MTGRATDATTGLAEALLAITHMYGVAKAEHRTTVHGTRGRRSLAARLATLEDVLQVLADAADPSTGSNQHPPAGQP